MTYNARTKRLEVHQDTLENVSHQMIYALRCIRELAGLPMDRYKQDGPLQRADHAQRAIIDMARHLGIDLGAEWGCDLDLREPDDFEENDQGQTTPHTTPKDHE